MISTNDVRPGMALELDDGLFSIVEYQHVKPGKGKAFVRMKLKKLDTGQVLDRTFRADENVQQAIIDRSDHQYLYSDDLGFHFMNLSDYGQIVLSKEDLGDSAGFLIPTIVLPAVAALLVWRFGTWAKVIGIVVALLTLGTLWFTAF
ncbi:MAG TPA: hypothetical protein VEB69_11115, partial [Acidimicrobiia bacterium]|nr:hypothetical protein [Acidimicrobiia bacterium]